MREFCHLCGHLFKRKGLTACGRQGGDILVPSPGSRVDANPHVAIVYAVATIYHSLLGHSRDCLVRCSRAHFFAVVGEFWHLLATFSRFRVPEIVFRHHTPNYSTSTLLQGARIVFSKPHAELFNFDPPDRGGVSDTVPSLKRHTKFYVKPNTGDGREPPPPTIQNRTQGTVKPSRRCYKKPNTGEGREPSPPLT